MFGSSMMGDFDEDMFMNNPMNMMQMQMRNMNRMMNSLMPDPFNMLMPFDQGRNNALMERNNGPPMGMGGLFGFPMPNMNRLLNADIGGNGGASFCSSSVISMSSGPDGRPQIYQASTSSKTGPGGIRETRKTVQDSSTGLKKMAIGHHIGDRSHIIEKEQDLRSGQLEERQEFINLDEEEAEDFDREFSTKARSGGHLLNAGRNGREILTIEDVDDADTYGGQRRQLPALPPAPSAVKRSTTTTASQNVTTSSSTSSPQYGRNYEPHDNNNYTSRRMSAQRIPSLGVHARRSLRTPISSPLVMSPTIGQHHHHHQLQHPATAAVSAIHPHPYKNAKTARRHHRARQNAVPQQHEEVEDDDDEPKDKMQKISKNVIEERNADNSLVIIEEPDDSDEEEGDKK